MGSRHWNWAKFCPALARFITLFALVLASEMPAQARAILPCFPEELEPKASLICTAEALSVETVSSPQPYTYYKDYALLEQTNRARLKILHRFKGDSLAEIDLIFRTSSGPVVNGPMHITMQPGQRYRCYLKPGDKPGQYVSVLDGKIDDCYAVFSLWLNEKNDSPCLTKEDVIRIARDYTDKQKPGNTYNWKNASPFFLPGYKGGIWSIAVSNSSGDSAQIDVRGDGTIDPEFTKIP